MFDFFFHYKYNGRFLLNIKIPSLCHYTDILALEKIVVFFNIKNPPLSGGLFAFQIYLNQAASLSFFFFIWVITASIAPSKLSSNDLEDCFTKNSCLGIMTFISTTLSFIV